MMCEDVNQLISFSYMLKAALKCKKYALGTISLLCSHNAIFTVLLYQWMQTLTVDKFTLCCDTMPE